MSYLVMARKYRPQTFSELIGQEHISALLEKAVTRDRIAHAYLFCGPRGVGKTSCARILAMALNNPEGSSITPDLDAPICREIANGTSFDVLEIDGASNRGIDEIRSLRENIKFAPSYGRYKIYIVDEVHMLTSEAFNALLKTLEEPPAHAKFIFATTEPNKVPATIISRCQRFDFKRIQVKTIAEVVEEISAKEQLEIDPEATYAIAKAAKGSLRDACSILDQLSAITERRIGSVDVFTMLGMVETQLLFDLTDALAANDCTTALDLLEGILEKGKDIKQLTKDLTEHYRNLMVIKVGGKTLGKLVDYPVNLKEALLKQTEHFTLDQILYSIELFIKAQETARIVESVRLPLEMAIAKLTLGEKTPAAGAKPPAPEKPSAPSTPVSTAPVSPQAPLPPVPPVTAKVPEKTVEPPPTTKESSSGDCTIDVIRSQWDSFTHALSKQKMSVATYLQDGHPELLRESLLTISFPTEAAFSKEALETPANLTFVQKAMEEHFGIPLHVKYVLTDQFIAPEEGGDVRSVIDAFGGSITNRWHNE